MLIVSHFIMYFGSTPYDAITDELIILIENKYGENAKLTKELVKKDTHSKSEIDRIVEIVTNGINLKNFEINQLRQFIKEYKGEYLKKGYKEGYTDQYKRSAKRIRAGTIMKDIGSVLQDIILFFITIIVVLTLRFRSSIKGTYLYPSDPDSFPYVFCGENQSTCISSVAKNYNVPFRPIISTEVWKKRINRQSLEPSEVFNEPTDFDENTKVAYIEHNFDNSQNVVPFSKSFMSEVQDKNIKELSTFSLIYYVALYIIYNTRRIFGTVHDNAFSPIFGSSNTIVFVVAIFLVFTFLKSFSIKANAIFKHHKNAFRRELFKVGFLIFLPLVSGVLFSLPFFYILSIWFSIVACCNYYSIANSFLFTRFWCILGVLLISTSAIYPLVRLYSEYFMASNKQDNKSNNESNNISNNEPGTDKIDQMEEKKANMENRIESRKDKKKEQKEKLKKYKKGTKKYNKMQSRVKRNRDRIKRKRKKIEKKEKKIKKKSRRRRKGKNNKEPFKDNCENLFSGLWDSMSSPAAFKSVFSIAPLFVPLFITILSCSQMIIQMHLHARLAWNDIQKIMSKNQVLLMVCYLVLITLSQFTSLFSDAQIGDKPTNAGKIISIILTNFIVLFIGRTLASSFKNLSVPPKVVNNNTAHLAEEPVTAKGDRGGIDEVVTQRDVKSPNEPATDSNANKR